MKVFFLKDSPKEASVNWRKGEIKEVSSGFAQNFLIPKGFAQVATAQIIAKAKKEAKEAETKKLKEIEKLQQLKLEIEKRTFAVKVKVGDKGQIFSGVHDKDIAGAINHKLNINIDRHQVDLKRPIKELGEQQIKLNLGAQIYVNVKIHIEPEK